MRIEVRRRVAEHVEQEPHGREIEVETELVHARFDGGPCDRLLVGLPDAQGASEQAREQRIGRLPVIGPGPRRPSLDAAPKAQRELRDQPALAHPCLTSDAQGATLAEHGARQGPAKKRELGDAPDQRR